MFRIIFASLLTVFAVAELPSEANTWTVEQVCEWVDSPGTEFQDPTGYFKDNVRKHGITGNILMVLEVNDLEEELGVTSGIERKKLMFDLDALENTYTGEAGLDFWENRALNRQLVDYAVPLLVSAPRWAITTIDDFPAYCKPEKDMGEDTNIVFAWIEWLLFPEYYIWINRDTIMCGLPGLIPYCVVAHLLLKIFLIAIGGVAKGVEGMIAIASMIVIYTIVTEISVGLGAYFYSVIIWKVLPGFISDLVFYFAVYIQPICQLFKTGNENSGRK